MSGIGGYYKPCCNTIEGFTTLRVEHLSLKEAFHSPAMEDLRQQFLDGKRPAICDVCWKREDGGHRSYRVNYHNKFGELLDPGLEPKLRYLDLRIDNSCNLQCRMCDPVSSDQIWKTIDYFKKNKMKIPAHYTYKVKGRGKNYHQDKKLAHILEVLPEVRVIKVTGGEPFKSDEFFHVMDVAIEKGYAKNIHVILTTNGTKFFKAVLDRLFQFKSMELNVSVDGTNLIYDYIRYPFKWSQWGDRIDELFASMTANESWRNGKCLVRMSCIVSAYNWFNVGDIYRALAAYVEKYPWLKETHFLSRVDFNLELQPTNSEIHAKYLPSHLLDAGIKKLRAVAPDLPQLAEFESFAARHQNDIPEKDIRQQQLKYFTESLDLEREQSYRTHLAAEFADWLDGVKVKSIALEELLEHDYLG